MVSLSNQKTQGDLFYFGKTDYDNYISRTDIRRQDVVDLQKVLAAAFIPDIYSRFEKYAYGRAIKEPFLRALFRSKNQDLEEGWFYPDEIMPPEMNEIERKTGEN